MSMRVSWIPVDFTNSYSTRSDEYFDRYEELEVLRSTVFSTGNLVKLEDGRILLVGDINHNRGLCGCCSVDVDPVAYARVFDMESVE